MTTFNLTANGLARNTSFDINVHWDDNVQSNCEGLSQDHEFWHRRSPGCSSEELEVWSLYF